MRKNKFMRLASALLVLTLLSTCAISGTFAKYVTSGEATDSARVAKWGVKVTANGTMFADSYNGKEGTWASAQTVLKSSADTSEYGLVAPGTSGEMVSMGLTGTPEVAVKVSYVAEVTLNDQWVDSNNAFYFPLVIKVEDTAVDFTGKTTAAEVEAAIEEAVKAYSKEYAPGTDLSTTGDDSLDVSWEWPFSTSDANDVKDTYLGDQAAADKAGTISIKVTTTVTQID